MVEAVLNSHAGSGENESHYAGQIYAVNAEGPLGNMMGSMSRF
jgi:hypothetical protein